MKFANLDFVRHILHHKHQHRASIPFLGVEPQLGIQPPEKATLYQETQLLSRVREMKLHPKTFSEGYETMTPDNSDIVSEVKQIL